MGFFSSLGMPFPLTYNLTRFGELRYGQKSYPFEHTPLVNFCTKDIRPFSIVDGKGFKEFCQTLITIGAKNGNLDINDVMPSRVTVSRKVEDKYNLLKSQFKESISKNDSFGITLDMWTNQYNHTSFLALTSHYITGDVSSNQLKINNYIVKNIEMKEKKEATKIRQILKDVLQEMNCFREDNVYVTDNGMNISKSVEVFNHISCSGQNINLALKHSINGNFLKNLIEKVKKVVGRLKYIKQLQVFIPSSCDTRFNSVYFMLKAFDKHFEKILSYSRDNKIDNTVNSRFS